MTQFRLIAFVLAALAAPAFAGSVTLNLCTLPSAQGFTYVSGAVPEAQVFSVNDCKLDQNSLGIGANVAFYEDAGIVGSSSFTVDWTAQLKAEELGGVGNSYGYGFIVETPSQQYNFGIGASALTVRNGSDELVILTSALSDAGIDVFQSNSYELAGDTAAGTWNLFIDGTFWASGTPEFVSGESQLDLGDLTAGPNAQGETSAFSFNQNPSAPEPATFWLVAGVVALPVGRSRIRRSKPGSAPLRSR